MNRTESNAPRILIVRLSALGDVVHALPVLYALRDSLPQAHLGWIVEDRFAEILAGNPAIDQLHVVPRGAWRKRGRRLREGAALVAELRRQRYDIAIDLQGLTKSGMWAWLSGACRRIGFAGSQCRELNRWLVNERTAIPASARHVIDKNLILARAAGAGDVPVRSDIPPITTAAEAVDQWWQRYGLGDNTVALSPGAGWPTKEWPPRSYARLADRIANECGARVLILWGPCEQELAGAVWRSAQVDHVVAPPTTLLELVESLRRCRAFIAGDTGPLHIAAALGVPCLAIFGASDPIRNGPYGPDHVVATHDYHCRPCWRTQCPTAMECLTELRPDSVWIAAQRSGMFSEKETQARNVTE